MFLKRLAQKGMTLPEVMIALAIMSGIGLVTAKLMGDQAARQNQIKMSAEVNTFTATLQNFLSDSSQCKLMFKNKVLTPGSDFTLGTPGTLDNSLLVFGPSGKTILAEKDYGMFSLADQSVKLKESTYGGNQAITANPDGSIKAATGVYDLNITFTPKVKSSLFTSNPSITKSIPIVLSFTTTGGTNPRTITGCGPVIQDSNVTAKKTLCDSLGGYAQWDSAAGECKLQEIKCPYGQAMIKMTSLGSKICAPIANQVDLSSIFNMSPVSCSGTGNISISISQNNGKFSLSCVKTGGVSNVNCVGSWSSCVGGFKTYTVTTPKQGSGTSCPNVTGDTQSCSTCTPVNGGWTAWSAYSACVSGSQTRYRTCTNPIPSCGGSACIGLSSQTAVCGGCFIAGTEIEMMSGEKKNIEDILLGDNLKDANGKRVSVKKLLVQNYWGEVFSINGGPYFFTPNHPFLTTQGWKSLLPEITKKESGITVSQLKIGDILLKKDGVEVVFTLDSKISKEKIFNFELDGSHTYLADEYLVHNKAAPPTTACCPSSGSMVSDCSTCSPLSYGQPSLCTSIATLQCAQ